MKHVVDHNCLKQNHFISTEGDGVTCRIMHKLSSASRAMESSYNSLPWPARKLVDIPIALALCIQRNTFPTIMFTEGYHVFRQNFGFSKENFIKSLFIGGLILQSPESVVRNIFLGGIMIGQASASRETAFNNLFLYGMFLCSVSKFYVNPWFDEHHEGINAIWHKIDDKTLSDTEYFETFNATTWEFTKALSALVSTQILNGIFSLLLKQTIAFKKQYELAQEWLSNDTAYVINAGNKSSGSEADNEKANLNPVKLFEDIEHQSALPSLWNTRINTIIDCLTACYALYMMSPFIILISFGYSLTFNMLLSFFEGPAHILHKKLNQLKDLIIRQITNIDYNAEQVTFLKGEEFEKEKLLALLNEKRRQSIMHDLLDSGKGFIINFIKEFQWLFPILATIKDVRSGTIKREKVGPCMSHYFRINSCMTFVKDHFEQLSETEEGNRRLDLYEERIEAGNAKRKEIAKKVTDSNEIKFSGQVFADEAHETLLAQGKFTLEPGSITHLDAPSGCGKTTLFRIFRGIWGNFDGECSLPKEQSVFLPSQVYVLGSDEPLFQTVCYPVKHDHETVASNVKQVKNWLVKLNLKPHIYNNLVKGFDKLVEDLPQSKNEKSKKNAVFNWMSALSDGERKRIAFCNILLKLQTEEVKFLAMDEPFKGIDKDTQLIMVELLNEVVGDRNTNPGSKKPKCTILFSNHEYNHGLNTHVLTVDEYTKQYHLEPVKI